MATFKEDITLKYQKTIDDPIEDVQFSSGDEVDIAKEWEQHYLIKDGEGRFFNVLKQYIEK